MRRPRREAASDLAATIGVPAASFFPPAFLGVLSFLSLTSTSEARAPEEEASGVEATGVEATGSGTQGVGTGGADLHGAEAMSAGAPDIDVEDEGSEGEDSSLAETAEVSRTRVPGTELTQLIKIKGL